MFVDLWIFQIRKSVSTIYLSLCRGPLWCASCMGKSEIPQPSQPPPRTHRRGEAFHQAIAAEPVQRRGSCIYFTVVLILYSLRVQSCSEPGIMQEGGVMICFPIATSELSAGWHNWQSRPLRLECPGWAHPARFSFVSLRVCDLGRSQNVTGGHMPGLWRTQFCQLCTGRTCCLRAPVVLVACKCPQPAKFVTLHKTKP